MHTYHKMCKDGFALDSNSQARDGHQEYRK